MGSVSRPALNANTAAPQAAIPQLAVGTAEAARILGLSKTWLEQLRVRNEGPKWVKVGSRVLYRVSDLEEFLAGNLREPRSPLAA